MATRYGYDVFTWLLDRGWQKASVPEEFICGDPHVIDPQTDKEYSVYEAAKIHQTRTGDYPEVLTKVGL